MQKNKLVILMPLYNREEYIAKALNSIFMQKVDFDYKVIIIDDCSTDKSLEIAKVYQEKHNNIDIIENKENLKLLKTIFKGYEKLENAEYFCVLDPDDYWVYEDKLQEAIDFLDKNPRYTIHATNIEVLEKNGKRSVFTDVSESFVISSYKDFLAGKGAYFSCTQGTIYRNVVFSKGLNPEISELLAFPYAQSFRADSFRNYLHLSHGDAYFDNKITAVYNMQSEGLWSNIDKRKRLLHNAQAYYAFSLFFEAERLFYLGQALWLLKPELENFVERMKKGDLAKEEIDIYQEFATLCQEIISALSENNLEAYEAKLKEGSLKKMLNTCAMFQKYLRIYIKKLHNEV